MKTIDINKDDIRHCAVMALIDVMEAASVFENALSKKRIGHAAPIAALDDCIGALKETKKAVAGVVVKDGFNSRDTQSPGIGRG